MSESADPNEGVFSDAIKSAGLPQFPDLTQVNRSLQAKAKSNVHHIPRQQGPYLVCVSCAHQHTLAYIGTDKKLVGVDKEGKPMIETR